MTFRHYEVLEPASEQELGKHLREYALGEAALKLVVVELQNELDQKRGQTTDLEEARMSIDSLNMGTQNDQLPYIIGPVQFSKSDIRGIGRLVVNGSRDIPENERPLTLHVYEPDE